MKSSVIVTGGAGFIGSALIRRLLANTDGFVVNIDALTYAGNLESLAAVADSPRYSFEQLDIRDQKSVFRVFDQHQPRSVIHLAAESHVDRSIDAPRAFVETNVVGTFSLLEVARDYWHSGGRPAGFRFVQVSTDEVFGAAEETSLRSEASPYPPISPYAATKAAADHLVQSWNKTYGLPVITTISSNNYGPFQYPDKLIPHMIITALEGRPLPVYGDGGQVRNWLHVEDQVDGLLAVEERGQIGGVYPICGKDEWQNIEIVRAVCANLDSLRPRVDGQSYADQISHVEDRPGHDRRYALDARTTEEELGWRPTRDLKAGLRDIVRWYLDNES
jgi:dTDP-glucose 4,6-dehydratase